MAGLRNLMILGVMLICVVVDVEGVTDQQFQELSNLVRRLQVENEEQFRHSYVLQQELTEMRNKNAEQDFLIEKLLGDRRDETNAQDKAESSDVELAQNATIEERVTLLELQVVEIQGDVAVLFENDDFLFDEQVIQDERLLNLETETEQIEEEVEILQDTTQELNFRVTVLEEGGGSGGNSSISELEERVETLEGTAADHETRISAAENGIEDLEGTTADHETRLTAAEENIQGLQMTDINHDARLTALEENGGGSLNETIAFQAYLTSYSTIENGETVVFHDVLLNEGEGYDSTTGVFTVPSNGGGLYFFSTYFLAQSAERTVLDMTLNDVPVCAAYGDDDTSNVFPQGGCTAVIIAAIGDEIKVVIQQNADSTPIEGGLYTWNGFNGFRISA